MTVKEFADYLLNNFNHDSEVFSRGTYGDCSGDFYAPSVTTEDINLKGEESCYDEKWEKIKRIKGIKNAVVIS